jgi:hypothetical protein
MSGEGEHGDPTAELRLQVDAERRRLDWLLQLMMQQGSALARIEQRCTAIEASIASRLTPAQWAKIIAGVALPLLVLILTGNAELARRFMMAP